MKNALVALISPGGNRPSVRLVRRSVLLTLILLGIYAALSLYYLSSLQSAMTQVSEVHNRKVELIHRMSNVVQARSLYLYTVVLNDDPWFRDEQFMAFRDAAVDFIRLRDDFTALGLEAEEQEILESALRIVRTTAPLQEDIMQRMQAGEAGTELWSDIIEKDLPLEMELLRQFNHLTAAVQANAHAARMNSDQRYRTALRVLSLVTLLIILSVLLGAVLVLTRLGAIESSLTEEKELALGTLNNIVDGVIVTDAQGTILSINRPASQMTGSPPEQALGRRIDDVYRLHPRDGSPIMAPSAFAASLSGASMRIDRQEVLESLDGVRRHVEETVSPIFDPQGRPVRVSYIFRDVSVDLARMQQMSWDASHDHLTGAFNRRAFEAVLERALTETDRHIEHTLLYLDMDDFKQLNDTFGHHAGDAYLVHLVKELSGCIRRQDVLARIGGDEFAVLLSNCRVSDADQIVENLVHTVSGLDFIFEGRRVAPLGVSIGLVEIGALDHDPTSIMRKVDEACYRAKREGKNRIFRADGATGGSTPVV